LEGLAMDDDGFYGHFVYFPVLVCRDEKNLATLNLGWTSGHLFPVSLPVGFRRHMDDSYYKYFLGTK
jgi:hypothetical protein